MQYERCLVFWARILRQAFDDLIALSNGYTVITDDGRRMPAAERAATLRDVQSGFSLTSDAPVSLAAYLRPPRSERRLDAGAGQGDR